MSALEQSVTLEDVFAVVTSKRVPLAPELAGYLTLEIAEGAQPSEGDVDPRTVFIGEEGSVALVRPKKENASGDAETSVRAILARLLEASGSQTPALGATARRKPSGGLPPLVAELEAALIPVNRAAGRRALARLAREVKRVTLGVGRNAAVPERPAASRGSVPSQPAVRADVPMRADLPPVSAPPVRPSAQHPVAAPTLPSSARVPVVPLAPTPAYSVVAPISVPRAVAESPRVATPEPPYVPTPEPPRAATPEPPYVASVEPPRVATPEPPRVATPEPARVASAEPPHVESFEEPSGSIPEPLPSEPFPDLEMLPRGISSAPPPPPAMPLASPEDAAFHTKAALLAAHLPAADEVDDLLAQFEVSGNTTDRAVSRELKAMVGLEPTPPPPSTPSPADEGVEQLLALSDQSVAIANVRRAAAAPPPSPVAAPPPLAPVAVPAIAAPIRPPPLTVPQQPQALPLPLPAPVRAATAPMPAPKPEQPPVASAREPARAQTAPVAREPRKPRAPKVDRILTVLTLLVLIGGAVLVWTLKPGFFTGRTPERIEQERKTAAVLASQQAAAQVVVRCRAALVITDVPPRAEVLLRHGQAPVDIEKMPVGARLELVATAEGFAPKRAVVPGGATWDGVDGKQRFEIAVQLDPTKVEPAKTKVTLDPWPSAEPGSHVGGSGPPGTVHVVSTPRGAEVWLLVGDAPEATIDPIKCDADVDVLVAGPTIFRKRLHVNAADVSAAPLGETGTPGAGAHVVKLSAK